MLKRTGDLKKILSKSHKVLEFVDYYSGKDCYIISCGPSLNDYNLKIIKSKLKNKLVMCVKQAYPLFEDICDIHISNFTNYTENNYNYRDTINVIGYLKNQHDLYLNNLKKISGIDVKFQIKLDLVYGNICMLAKKDFYGMDKMIDNFLNNKIAIVGPGIVYEICFPLAIAMGVKSITTIGWDIGPSSSTQKYEHFYDKASRYYNLKGKNSNKNLNHLKLRHEAKLISSASKNYSNFLSKNGVELRILSKRNMADGSIKRIKLKEL